MSNELSRALETIVRLGADRPLGPCVICEATGYSMSRGGPDICPKCDCRHSDAATVEQQAKVIAQLRIDVEDVKADALRLHRDKMAYFEAALALVHSETIKSVCGWYPEIEAFRKLVCVNQQGPNEKNLAANSQ